MIIFAMGGGAALSFIFGVWGFALARTGERVAPSAVPQPAKRADRSNMPVLNAVAGRVGRPFTGMAMDLLAPWRVKIRKRIDSAGRPGGMTVESYARQTAGFIVIFGGFGLFLLINGQLIFGVLVMLGALQNELLLYGRMRTRQDDIERTLPDFLDVLAVTVSAGLSFRVALSRVSESMPGPLAEEFMVALRQMELGTPRREAFEDLRSRNSAEALGSFVTAILQAEELGAPLETALMEISVDMRRQAAQWAKRKAQRTNPSITAVTTALAMPALMAVVIGAMLFGAGVLGGSDGTVGR